MAPSPEYIRLNKRVLEIVKHFANENICHGPQVLVAAGVLSGRECAAYPAVSPDIEAAGGKYISLDMDKAHVDGNLVTAPAFLKVLGAEINFQFLYML